MGDVIVGILPFVMVIIVPLNFLDEMDEIGIVHRNLVVINGIIEGGTFSS